MVIGLEIHVQLKTDTKIFCGCKAKFGDSPNSNVCPVCLGLPGSLPVLNKKAVDMAVKAGLALNCSITPKSVFARKNYFYPDLPKGYQISQMDLPVCGTGELTFPMDDGSEKTVRLTRIHMEEDAGKLIHDQDVNSLFDANRCCTPLIEIVTEPDIRSAKEAYHFLTNLKQILEYLEVSDCNMEEGSLRCDVNISLRPFGQEKLGTKAELKNMNSFKNVEKAIEYEYYRQKDVLESGGAVLQQTFLWDPNKNITIPMRTKENAHDYRYVPDPDLPPLIISDEKRDSIGAALPELPLARKRRFVEQYELSENHADVLTEAKEYADYFEDLCKKSEDPRSSAVWVMGDVLRICKEEKRELSELYITTDRLGELLLAVSKGTISQSAAKKVFNKMEEEQKEASVLIEELGLVQISDSSELEGVIAKILEDNPDEVSRFRDGEKKLTSFFVGQAMKATRGKGNPKEINKILMTKLNG